MQLMLAVNWVLSRPEHIHMDLCVAWVSSRHGDWVLYGSVPRKNYIKDTLTFQPSLGSHTPLLWHTQSRGVQPWEVCAVLYLVARSCSTLCDPMDCSPPASSVLGDSPGKNTGEHGLPCPPPGDLPKPGIKPRSPTMQADSLPSKPPGNPKNTRVGSLSLLQGIFPAQQSNWGLLHWRWIFYQLSYKGSPHES